LVASQPGSVGVAGAESAMALAVESSIQSVITANAAPAARAVAGSS